MTLYRFRYSCYARKVQMLLDLMGAQYDIVEVPYVNREELAQLTGGYIYVPVLVDDTGRVFTESRDICEHLLATGGEASARLLPAPWQGPIWAYNDFADGQLEDVVFRIATPYVHDTWPTAFERALYKLVKERKFGAGCIEAWRRDEPNLIAKTRRLLSATFRTLEAQPFLFGQNPTLADAALYGLFIMLEEADRGLVARVAEPLVPYMQRLEAKAGIARKS